MSSLVAKTLLSSTALLFLAACSSTGSVAPETPAAAPAAPAAPASQATAVSQNGLTKEDLAALRDPANPLSKRSVYFDYDSNAVKTEQRPVVETHGKFLAKKAGVKITVQGNTDERGSREYNLALGQRRADAVKQAMSAYGVTGEQVETVSFGSEKPVTEGHEESAWSKNRRADIVYPGE